MSKVTIFYGLYGSGKSEISMNYALKVRRQGVDDVTIVDLDAVTPYFRVRDVSQVLAQSGIRVISPKDAPKFSDLPVLPQGVRGVFDRERGHVIVDVGGDPTGARVLGGLKDVLPPSARVLFVVNFMRPFSETPERARIALERISETSQVRPTGLVINNHLGKLTRVSHLENGYRMGKELATMAGLSIEFMVMPIWFKREEGAILKWLENTEILWLERFFAAPWEEFDV